MMRRTLCCQMFLSLSGHSGRSSTSATPSLMLCITCTGCQGDAAAETIALIFWALFPRTAPFAGGEGHRKDGQAKTA